MLPTHDIHKGERVRTLTRHLPAPEGEFIPTLRMYWPKEKAPSVLNGSWTPPQVVKVQ